MLSLLIGSVISAKIRIVKPTKSTKTAFDLAYDDGKTQTSITGGEGFYVAIRDRDDPNKELNFLEWNTEINTDKYRVYLSTLEEKDPDCKRIHVGVQNYDQEQYLNIDIGMFADANFKTDQDTLSMVLNRRAIEIKSAKDGDESLVMLIVNGSNYVSVDSLYLGKLANSETYDRTTYPYWDNSPESTQKTDDSVFAFSWQNRRIPPKRTARYGFIAVPKATYSTEPFIYDTTEDLNQKLGVQKLRFTILDYDPDDELKLHIKINGVTHNFKALPAKDGADKVLRRIYYNITLEAGKSYEISAWVTDKSKRSSKTIKKRIYAFGGKTPELVVLNQLEKEYNPNDLIYVEGKIDDEYSVWICYQFDDSEPIVEPKAEYTWLSGYESFMRNIEIPKSLKFGPHYLLIWAQDEYGLKSNITTHRFEYKRADRPYIASIFLSDERLIFNEEHEIIIYGEGTDPDENQQVTLYAKLDNGDADSVGSFISTNKLGTFAYFYQIKSGLSKGRHKLTFYLQDDTNKKSKVESVLSFLIYDPNDNLPPAEIGKIEDVSSETINPQTSNALFNLKYYDVNGIGSDMTFNNEGFFAAFRVWTKARLGWPKKAHIIKFSGYQSTQAEADGFSIYHVVINDTETGYKRIQFTVTNNNFWPKAFELGVFADSDFSGDDNSEIKMRDDERGFIVTNEAKKIHYTIFTRDVYGSPPVTRHYLAKVEREGTDEIPSNQMPFFGYTDTTKTKSLRGVNTGYAFSWKYVVNPNQPVTFSVLVAAHDKVKTPPRVIDNTIVPENIQPGDVVNLSFTIRDADPGETIMYNVTINDTVKTFEYVNDGRPRTFNESIHITEGWEYLEYTVKAKDKEVGASLVSNVIFKFIWLTDKPVLKINPIRDSYHTYSEIPIEGNFEDSEGEVTLYYQFVDGEYRSRRNYLTYTNTLWNPDNLIHTKIKMPEELEPRDEPYGLVLYGLDELKVKSNEIRYDFTLRVWDPPVLYKAGLSKKIVNVGDRVLGYASISDNQESYINVYVKVGLRTPYNESLVLHYVNKENAGDKKPVAFFWDVPDVEPGTYDVAIYIRDSEDIWSWDYKAVTCIINKK